MPLLFEVAEFDAPEKLLENKDSIFYSLAADAGLAPVVQV